MRQGFTVIAGGRVPGAPAGDAAQSGPATWRVDLRRASAIGEAEIAAWRALLVRARVAAPVHADPDYLIPAAQHRAGGRDLVFALAWAAGDGPEQLGAVVPLALPHSLWGGDRIVVWRPAGTAVAPTIAAGCEAGLRDALVARLRETRPRSVLDLGLDAPAPLAPPVSRLRAVSPGGVIPAHSLVGVRPADAPAQPAIERIRDPRRIPEAVEAFLRHDAEVSASPILADPSEAALVRTVTRRFAQRDQVTVALTRRAGAVVAASVTLGAGGQSVLWRQAGGAARRIERSA